MSTLVQAFNGKLGGGSGVGRFLFTFGLRFSVIAAVAFLVAVVSMIGLFLANIDTLFAGLLEMQDSILIPVQDNSSLRN